MPLLQDNKTKGINNKEPHEDESKPYTHPFTWLGVDHFRLILAGEVQTIENKWGIIFLCMATRAVDFKLIKELNINLFIECLNEFRVEQKEEPFSNDDAEINFVSIGEGLQSMIKQFHRNTERDTRIKCQKGTLYSPSTSIDTNTWQGLTKKMKDSLTSMINLSTEEMNSSLVCAEHNQFNAIGIPTSR